MANNYIGNDDAYAGGGYGLSGLGGGGMMLALFLIVLFGIFGGNWGFGGRREERGEGCGCGHRTHPWFPDESNYQEERNLDNKICSSTDKILAAQGKTDGLIVGNVIQELRDKNLEKDFKIQALEGRIYSDAKFGAIDAKLGHIECEMLKRPPVWGCADTPVVKHLDNKCNPCGEARRGRFDDAVGF